MPFLSPTGNAEKADYINAVFLPVHLWSFLRNYSPQKCSHEACFLTIIVGYPTVHYSAMLRYVPWSIWLGKSGSKEK